MWQTLRKHLLASTPLSLFMRDEIRTIDESSWLKQTNLGPKVTGFGPPLKTLKPGNNFIDSLKERIEPAIDTLRSYQNQGIDYIRSALNSAGIGIRKIIGGDGRVVHEVIADGTKTPAYMVGVTSKVANKATLTKETVSLSPEARARREEMHMAETLMRKKVQTPSYMEYKVLSGFTNPRTRDGYISEEFEGGWPTYTNMISQLPVPTRYDDRKYSMGFTVRNGVSYIGVSATTAQANRVETLKTLFEKANELNLTIPNRKDGTQVTVDNLDMEAERCLVGTLKSPFMAGGDPLLAEGSEILINDNALVRASRIHRNLDAEHMSKLFTEYVSEQAPVFKDMIAQTQDKEVRAIYERDLEALNTPAMGSYNDYISAIGEKTRQAEESAKLAVQAEAISPDEDVGFGFGDIVRENIESMDSITYEEAKAKGFEPTPENTGFFRENDGNMRVVSYANGKDMTKMGIQLKDTTIKGEVPTYELADGRYFSNKGEVINVSGGYVDVEQEEKQNIFSDEVIGKNEPEEQVKPTPAPTPFPKIPTEPNPMLHVA